MQLMHNLRSENKTRPVDMALLDFPHKLLKFFCLLFKSKMGFLHRDQIPIFLYQNFGKFLVLANQAFIFLSKNKVLLPDLVHNYKFI